MNLKIRKPNNLDLAIKRFVVFALPAILIAGAFGANIIMGALTPKPEEDEEIVKATPVVVAEAQAEAITLTINAQGEARPRREVDLTAQISGKITGVSPAYVEGGAFEEGDMLVQVDPAEFRFRVTQARSNVAQASSRYASEKAEADIARKEWEELGKGEGSDLALREPQLAEAVAALAAARAALNEAELQLERTTIRAPFKGRIQTKLADIGQFVAPGQSLGQIFSTDIMQVALPLTDAELGQLGLTLGFFARADEPGPKVTLSALVGGEPHQWQGRITRTSANYDRTTRVVFAYVEVEDPYGAAAITGAPLASGLFVDASIEGRTIDNGVVIPRSGLRGDDKVFIARDDDTLEIRTVNVVSSDRRRAVLAGGLAQGERVIISPVRGAADGVELAIAGDQSSTDTTTTVADASGN